MLLGNICTWKDQDDQGSAAASPAQRHNNKEWDRENVLQRMFRWGQVVLETFSRMVFKQKALLQGKTSAGTNITAQTGQTHHEAMRGVAREVAIGSLDFQGLSAEFLQKANTGNSESDLCFRETLGDVRHQLETRTISTAFSGVDAPGTSLLCLGWGVCEALQIPCTDVSDLPQAEHTFAIEFYSKSQEELALHPHKPSCIFSNMLDFLEPELRARLPALAERGVLQEVLTPLIKSGKAVRPDAPCLVHGRRCKATNSDIHCAGTPCTEYSPKGLREAEGGKTYAAFLTWAGQRLEAQEEVIIQENVQQFPVEQLQAVLGQLYFIESVVLSPRMVGWPVERKRRWSVLRHRYKTKAFKSPLSYFASMFRLPTCWGAWTEDAQASVPAWDTFFAASRAELEQELQWAVNRPESMFSRMNVLKDERENDDCEEAEAEDISKGTPVMLLDKPNAFYSALNSMEQQHLQDILRILQLSQLSALIHVHVDC